MKNFLFLFFFITNFFYGQSKVNLPSGVNFTPENFTKIEYGKNKYNVFYDVSFSPDSKFPEKKSELKYLLQINGKVSKFMDPNRLGQDSLAYEYKDKKQLTNIELNKFLQTNVRSHKVVLKNNADNKLIVQNRHGKRYQYEETLPEINWLIHNEEKVILGNRCKKATAHFRGRSFVAWFANDITISDGPDVFYGLPGLILEINDEQNHFHYKAVEIIKDETQIYLMDYYSTLKVSRSQFRDLQKNYFNNAGFYHTSAFNSDGSRIASSPIPYNPIELE